MQLSGHKVLITGGASGIGLALAKIFFEADSHVIICGRREKVLKDIEEEFASTKNSKAKLFIKVSDLESAKERLALREWIAREHPDTNILINNAGIQQRLNVDDDEFGIKAEQEIKINLIAPMHLSALFIPLLSRQKNASIMNVTSGLSFSPLANVPVYSSTKAALHSFTLSLRHQLNSKNISVIEIIPPAVDTDLGGEGLHTFGVPVSEFAAAVKQGLLEGKGEIGYGFAEKARLGSRAELDQIFSRMNNPAA